MKTIKGPGIFLAQFVGAEPPFDKLETLADWAAGLGYVGLQLPTGEGGLFDVEKGAESQAYCDDVAGMLADKGLQVTELSTHLQGQLVAVHPAYDSLFDGFAPAQVRGRPEIFALGDCAAATQNKMRRLHHPSSDASPGV